MRVERIQPREYNSPHPLYPGSLSETYHLGVVDAVLDLVDDLGHQAFLLLVPDGGFVAHPGIQHRLDLGVEGDALLEGVGLGLQRRDFLCVGGGGGGGGRGDVQGEVRVRGGER